MEKKEFLYVEPADYFPKEIRNKCGLGEFAVSDQRESNNNSANKEKNNENNHS